MAVILESSKQENRREKKNKLSNQASKHPQRHYSNFSNRYEPCGWKFLDGCKVVKDGLLKFSQYLDLFKGCKPGGREV